MNKNEFVKFELNCGDSIWIVNKKGEGFPGNYDGNFNSVNETFRFKNHSNGQTQIVAIKSLQRLTITERV